jgi:hypothetical protein
VWLAANAAGRSPLVAGVKGLGLLGATNASKRVVDACPRRQTHPGGPSAELALSRDLESPASSEGAVALDEHRARRRHVLCQAQAVEASAIAAPLSVFVPGATLDRARCARIRL